MTAALLFGLASGGPTAADSFCRTTALGSLACSGPAERPPPRRPAEPGEVQALDPILRETAPEPPKTVIVPAQRVRRLGGPVIDGPAPLPGACRPDRLGNLRCR